MLFADKHALEKQLECDLIGIRKQELDHYVHCCLTLSAPAALLAGFAYTALVQVYVPPDSHPATVAIFYVSVIGAMLANVAAVVKVTLLALCAPHLALRGPPGSMTVAVDKMRPAFYRGLHYFYMGLLCFHISAGVTIWLNSQSDTLVSLLTSALLLLLSGLISLDIRCTIRTFHLPKRHAVDGKFMPNGDAAGTARVLIHRLQHPTREPSRSALVDSPSRSRSLAARIGRRLGGRRASSKQLSLSLPEPVQSIRIELAPPQPPPRMGPGPTPHMLPRPAAISIGRARGPTVSLFSGLSVRTGSAASPGGACRQAPPNGPPRQGLSSGDASGERSASRINRLRLDGL
ncbi:hypothetical protein T492DRAFT_968961 [Pavlovales sp. CCMP2436]|nr:hypothetical protein T492DRAFT_968961 [Pavlovales sp. CCMP2436]